MFYRLYIELNKTKSFAAREALLHDLDNPHAQWNLQDEQLPDYKPQFGDLRLTAESSLVDFVDDGSAIGGHGLLVSEKALSVLQKLTLPPNRAYSLTATHRGKKISEKYYWLQILSVDYSDWIDYSKSEFQLRSQFEMDPDVPGENAVIQNAKEFKKLLETLGENDQELLFSKLVLNEKFKQLNFDIFYLPQLAGVQASFPIVNERLRNAFEKNKLVGYQLRSVPIELN
ncbi:MAG TPA: hypothetical protein VGD65_09530 [Chryseosolibacter sp.]